jgi:hypothetical protein
MSDRSQLNGPLGNIEGSQISGPGDYQTQKFHIKSALCTRPGFVEILKWLRVRMVYTIVKNKWAICDENSF